MADGETHLYYLNKGWYLIIPLGLIVLLMSIASDNQYWFLYTPLLYFNFYLCRFIDPDDDQFSLTTSEGRILRGTRSIYLGFFGANFVAYKFIYAYIAGLFGGHRSWFSHGIGLLSIGTIGRIIFYNIPPLVLINFLYSLTITYWGWTTDVSWWDSFYMNVWFEPYISTQFLAWYIADTIHLILDTDWAKGRLYKPTKEKR